MAKKTLVPLKAVASKRSDVAPFLAMDVLSEAKAIAAAGSHVIHMEVGEPGSPAPEIVREAAKAAIDHGVIGYTQALGLPSLRSRIAAHYSDSYGLDVAADRIIVTTGSSAGFILSFLALFDAGARVAIAAPGYPAYRNIMKALDIRSVELPTGADTRFALTGAHISAAHAKEPLDGVLVMSPANPTGVMMRDEDLEDVARTCDRLGIWFVSDEIYHGLSYERPAETALRFSADAVIVNSFSKYFCMTGWRIGWLVVPERLIRPIERLAQNLFISPPYLSQVAAEAAFEAKLELDAIRDGYARNRTVLTQSLARMGISHLPIDGAFYAYLDIGHLTNDSLDFCRRVLREAGVALTPGLDFDTQNGARFVRMSFAGSEAAVRAGCERLAAWLGGI